MQKMQMDYIGYYTELAQSEKRGEKKGRILARFEDGMTVDEIASKMGESVEYVEKIIRESAKETEPSS